MRVELVCLHVCIYVYVYAIAGVCYSFILFCLTPVSDNMQLYK